MRKIVKKPSSFYSPLRYPGGKAKLTDFLSNVIDYNQLGGCTYIEPYAGGAGEALSLLILEKVDRIIINDFDFAIYSLWDQVVNNHEFIIKKIRDTEVSVNEWIRQRAIYKDKCSSHEDKGFATFYLNRCNHSGIIEGRPIGGFKQASKWDISARYNKEKLIKRIEKIAYYRSRITVTNLDGIALMNQLVDINSNQLFYIDPPYFEKGNSLYLNSYTPSNHTHLANFLNQKQNIHWILTYDNVPEISKLYEDRSMRTFDINYSANKHRKMKELMVYSDIMSLPKYYAT